jgi:hypothetical protein
MSASRWEHKGFLLLGCLFALTALPTRAQQSHFLPGHLAVLRAGDGVLDLHLKQSPLFIDQFDPAGLNASPSFTVSIPTNGPDTLFFNGHAATEGTLTRSPDHMLLAFAGYGGVALLENRGTPSLLDIGRGFCTVDAAGAIHTTIYKIHNELEKMNPRGVVTDGTNGFWGCGNAHGTYYYNKTAAGDPVEFTAIPNSRALRIINGVLYATLNGADGNASDLSAGVFSFEDGGGNSSALPKAPASVLKPFLKAQAPYTKNVSFDIKPDGSIAYMADIVGGVEKYVRTNSVWKLAYNFTIPQVIPAADNNATGCFGLVVDFTGQAPVIYATTAEGYGGCVNSNRVVRIVDTSATAAVTTIAQAGSLKIAYRGIDFTPESKASKQLSASTGQSR